MYKSNCKNCDHNIHIGLCPVAFIDYNGGDPSEPTYCERDEYIPSENLEFLEYKYVRRRIKI